MPIKLFENWLIKEEKEVKPLQTINQFNEEIDDGAQLVYSDKKWKIYHITSLEGAIKYGKGAKWWVTDKNIAGGTFDDNVTEKVYFYFDLKHPSSNLQTGDKLPYTPYFVYVFASGDYRIYDQEGLDVDKINNAPRVKGLPNLTIVPSKITLYYGGQSISKELIDKVSKVIIEDDFNKIPSKAFYNFSNLHTIKIPSSVKQIGSNAFYSCTSLMHIKLPNSIREIDSDAFANCSGLISIALPRRITKLSMYTFAGCIRLSEVTIPRSVTKIENGAFLRCFCLKDVYYTGSEEEWNMIDIENNNDDLQSATIHFNA